MALKQDSAALGSAMERNPSLPFLLGCCCIGFLLFILAVTIVLSLIPVYLPSKADGLNKVNSTSGTVTMYGSTASGSGRKRSTSTIDLSSCDDCTMGPSGQEKVRQQLVKYLPKAIAKDIVMESVIFTLSGSSKKKRFASQRNVRSLSTYYYVMQFMIVYASDCYHSCQMDGSSSLYSALSSIPPGAFTFYDVDIYRDGALFGILPVLQTAGFPYLSSIVPASAPMPPRGMEPVTHRITTSTVSTTPAVSG